MQFPIGKTFVKTMDILVQSRIIVSSMLFVQVFYNTRVISAISLTDLQPYIKDPQNISDYSEYVAQVNFRSRVRNALRENTETVDAIDDEVKFLATGWDVKCKLQVNGYDCDGRGMSGRFYYDILLGDCKTGDFGAGCNLNLNMFSSKFECQEICRDVGEHMITTRLDPFTYCRLQPAFGNCHGYHPRFYFDLSTRSCKGFSYSGCGGNQNRFISYQVCSALCYPSINY